MGRPKGSTNKPKEQTEMMDEAEVVEVEAGEVRPQQAMAVQQPMGVTPMGMIDRAITSGASVEVLEKLLDLQDRWDNKQARRAFDEAMANAKAEIPTIMKNRAVDFTSQKGRTNYRYEDLESVASAVAPALSKYGLSYRYRATSNVNEPVTVTCIISHRAGHFEELTLAAGRDDSGNKNSIQAISSTMTYLQRISLKAALGLAVSNDDDDGHASEQKPKDNGPPRQPAKQEPEQARDGTPPRRVPPKDDPISSGPPRTTPKVEQIKDTGPSDPGPQPHQIPGKGETFESWSEKFIDLIRTSPDISTCYQWIDKNAEPLGRLKKGKPSCSGQVDIAIKRTMESLKDEKEKAEQKAAKKAAPPPVEMNGDIDSETNGPEDSNPETIIKWAKAQFATVDDADNLPIFFESMIEPHLEGLFPPDREEIMAEYRLTERRLGHD